MHWGYVKNQRFAWNLTVFFVFFGEVDEVAVIKVGEGVREAFGAEQLMPTGGSIHTDFASKAGYEDTASVGKINTLAVDSYIRTTHPHIMG